MAPHRCDHPNFHTDFHRSIWLWPPKIGLYGFSASFIKTLKTLASQESGFSKIHKNWSEPINLYSFSCRKRFWSPNRTKTDPGPDFDQFSKKSIYHAERNMGMKPSKIWDLWTSAWGSKAALKKLSFTWFPTDFDRFKIGFETDFRKIRGWAGAAASAARPFK